MPRRRKPKQRPGCLPPGCDLDSLLTPEQCAVWQQVEIVQVRRRLASMPGVVWESRKCVRIHPRTFLEQRLKSETS